MADICDAKAAYPELRDLDVEPYLVYAGPGPWDPTTSIEGKSFWFRHHAADARTWSPTPYPEAENPDDIAFSVLCRGGSEPAMLHEILDKLEPVPEPRRSHGFTTLTVLSALRGIVPLILPEIKKRGAAYDFAKSEPIQEIVRANTRSVLREATEGVQETAERLRHERIDLAVNVLLQLRRHHVPASVRDRFQACAPEDLDDEFVMVPAED